MKTKFTLLAILVAVFSMGNAQQAVPNGGFETWSSAYAPTGWTSYEEIIPPIAGIGLCVKDSIDKYSGTASVKLTTRYVALAQGTVGAAVALGTGTFDGQQPKIPGIPFTSSPDTLQFAYKSSPVGNDTAGFQIALHKLGGGSNGYKLAFGGQLNATGGQWGLITIPLKQYYMDTTGTGDTLKLSFFSSYLQVDTSPVGSTMNVDAVRFGYKSIPSFIENINNNLNVRVFPNPATDLVNIQTSEPVNNASIVVYDMTGRVITHEFGGSNNFELVTANWESGVYSYSILSGGVVVNKGRIVVQH